MPNVKKEMAWIANRTLFIRSLRDFARKDRSLWYNVDEAYRHHQAMSREDACDILGPRAAFRLRKSKGR
jgi:hypothetical protein